MKHKLLSALFIATLILFGCSKPELLDGPKRSLLYEPLDISLEGLANRAIAGLYVYDPNDNWKIEKVTDSEVVIDLNEEKTLPDDYPETLTISHADNNTYLVKLLTTRNSFDYYYTDLINNFLIDKKGKQLKNYNLGHIDVHSKTVNGNEETVIDGHNKDWNMQAKFIWYVDSHNEYSHNPDRDKSSDLLEAQILYTKES